MEYKLNNDNLRKLLYNDHVEDNQRAYLNINLLRHFKNYLLDNLNEKEKGCINLYHLENYLIERALDPMTEEIYKSKIILIKYIKLDCDDLVKDTLDYLRSRPEYWIINSEIYLDILSQNEDNFNDDKYENKDLTAIYNYIYINKFVNKNEVYLNVEEQIIPNYINAENIKNLIKDSEYISFINLLERESHLEINETFKTIYDVSIIPLIYKFMLEKFGNLFSDQIFDFEFKLQNFILFFSYVQYDKDLDILWNNPIKSARFNSGNNLINPNGKKYSLRINKINEEELDHIFFQNQIKILGLEDRINNLKNKERIKEFYEFLKNHKVIKFFKNLNLDYSRNLQRRKDN